METNENINDEVLCTEADTQTDAAQDAIGESAAEQGAQINGEVKSEGDGEKYFDKLAKEDIDEIHRAFPESREIESVTQLDNPLRYAALRDLGLTAREAYLATQSRREHYDNRKHLRGSVPSASYASSDAMSQAELSVARELFSGLDDRELQRLYKKVTK